MRPVKQTKLFSKEGGHSGNCYAAVMASMLDIPLWMVPPFEDGFGRSEWYETRASEWLAKMFGLKIVHHEGHPVDELPEFYVASGKSPRGVSHAVVYSKGVMVHDPHYSDSGIASVDRVWYLEPVDPAAEEQKRQQFEDATRFRYLATNDLTAEYCEYMEDFINDRPVLKLAETIDRKMKENPVE